MIFALKIKIVCAWFTLISTNIHMSVGVGLGGQIATQLDHFGWNIHTYSTNQMKPPTPLLGGWSISDGIG